MKDKSIGELLIGWFFDLILIALGIWWVALLLEWFWEILLWTFATPFRIGALILVLAVVYYKKKEEILSLTAILKEKTQIFKEKFAK